MEEKQNPTKPSMLFKFNSSYLNQPFQQEDKNEANINEEIWQEYPETRSPNDNNPNMNVSESSIQQNNESMISKNSMTGTVAFTKNNLNTQFTHEQPWIDNWNNSTSSFKKRKPFDKWSFKSSESSSSWAEGLKSDKNKKNEINNQEDKTNMSSLINNNTGIAGNSNMNQSINTNNPNNISMWSASNITNEEKTMIMSCYKLWSKETLEKAKRFNNHYKDSTPFWIKFFEDIETGTLKDNSSYFKVNNKSEYVRNLVEMVQRDADIYDEMIKNKRSKEETQNTIKQIIQDSNHDYNNNNNTSVVSTDSKKEAKNNIKNNVDTETDLDKSQIELNTKLNQVLSVYNKLDQKDKKRCHNENNYEAFKFSLITGGKFTSTTPVNDRDENGNTPLENIERWQKLESWDDVKNANQPNKPDKPPTQSSETEFKTIDNLYFGDDYTFEELNYDKIDFVYYNGETLRKLLALDKRWHEIDPVKYNTSINTELKKIQDEYNKGKKEREEKIEKETKAKVDAYVKKHFSEKKKTIFDVQEKDETKIKYKDYLHDYSDQKKAQRLMDNAMKSLDNKIKDIYEKDISVDKRKQFFQSLESQHSTDEFKEKCKNVNVPGWTKWNKVQKDLNDFAMKHNELLKGIELIQKEIEEENNKDLERKKCEEEKFKMEVVEPFYSYWNDVDTIDKNNVECSNKLIALENANSKEEELWIESQKRIEKWIKDKHDYEKIFEDADKIMAERLEAGTGSNDISEINDIKAEIEEEKKYKSNLEVLLREAEEIYNNTTTVDEKVKWNWNEIQKIKSNLEKTEELINSQLNEEGCGVIQKKEKTWNISRENDKDLEKLYEEYNRNKEDIAKREQRIKEFEEKERLKQLIKKDEEEDDAGEIEVLNTSFTPEERKLLEDDNREMVDENVNEVFDDSLDKGEENEDFEKDSIEFDEK